MNTWYLYFLLPAILFPLVWTINTAYGRKIGSQKLSLYRQFTLTLVWLPIAFSLIQKSHLLEENIFSIVLCWLLWASYLTIAFYSLNLTSVWISRSFVAISRTICAFAIWFFLFGESISIFDYFWVVVILLWFYLLSKASWERLSKNDILWIILWLTWWVLFSLNNLVFKNISTVFSPIESAYILEASSFLPLLILYTLTHKKQDFISMKYDWKMLWVLSLSAPLIFLAGYWLAQSIHQIPFYIFNTLFVLVLVTSMIFARIFLGEKISFTRWIALGAMVLGCVVIVLF